MKNKLLICASLALLVSAFGYGLAQLFVWRFESGDIYPAYSSLRADPLGTKGLHDALRQLPGVEVQRNYDRLTKLPLSRSSTIFLTGLDSRGVLTDDALAHLHALVIAGSRLVITFSPALNERKSGEVARSRPTSPAQQRAEIKRRRQQSETEKKNGTEPPAEVSVKPEVAGVPLRSGIRRWGAGFDYAKEGFRSGAMVAPAVLEGEEALEPQLSWHSVLFFTGLDPSWRVLYSCANRPVLIERSLGRGSLVLAADSYFLSNQAMANERCPKLLAALVGSQAIVVFDETLHGLQSTPGLLSLARRYRLHGLAAALVAVAGLVVWKSIAPLVPSPHGMIGGPEVVAGRDMATGVVNLLRRSIPPSEIVRVCIDEWKKSSPVPDAVRSQIFERLDAVARESPKESALRRDIAGTYRQICRILSEKTP